MTELPLTSEWAARDKIMAEVDELWSSAEKLWAEGYKGWAEGDKLWVEGDNLRADGDVAWDDAVIKCYGSIEVEWDNGACVVGGHRYEISTPPQSEAGR